MDASFKDDVTVILLLGVSFAVAFNEAPAKEWKKRTGQVVFSILRLAIDSPLGFCVHRGT
jgi:hypothetical protein